MWILYSFLSAVFAALVAIFGKLGLQKIDSNIATTLRSAVMLLFLSLFTVSMRLFRGSVWQPLKMSDWLLIVAAGVCGSLSWLAYFMALKSGPTVAVSAIDRLSIVFVLFFSFLFLHEAFRLRSFIGVTLMFVGAILIVLK